MHFFNKSFSLFKIGRMKQNNSNITVQEIIQSSSNADAEVEPMDIFFIQQIN